MVRFSHLALESTSIDAYKTDYMYLRYDQQPETLPGALIDQVICVTSVSFVGFAVIVHFARCVRGPGPLCPSHLVRMLEV